MFGSSARSPFGGLLEEIREERATPAPKARRPAPARRPRPRLPQGPEPDLRLEAGVVSGARAADPHPSRWRWAPSFVLHGAFLIALFVVPVLRSELLPPPASATRSFFVDPVLAAPPLPPPPPPPKAAARMAKSVPKPRPVTLAPQVEAPVELRPDDVVDTLEPGTADGGIPGGVDGGVPGGILGGVIAHEAPEASPPPARVRAGIDVKEPKKVKDVAPVYPDVAARANIEGVVIVELTIGPDGRVTDVKILRGVPLLDAAALTAARQWVFARTLLDGVPVSVTMTVPVRFKLT